MFTGIIEELGTVTSLRKKVNLATLRIKANKILRGLKVGDSVAVDGVCLTVSAIENQVLCFDVMRETLKVTALKHCVQASKVNLERALKFNDRLSGHFVTGHIDEIGKIENKISKKNYTELKIRLPKRLAPYIVPKGSICLDGVSLTVGEVSKTSFSAYLIPYTKQVTTLGLKKKNDHINIEADILSKYVMNIINGKT